MWYNVHTIVKKMEHKKMPRYTDYFRGRPLNSYPDDYTVIDIETTGFDPIRNKITEISAVKYRCNRKVDEYVTFVAINEKIPDQITKLTGITNDMLEGAPSIADALKGFLSFIGEDILIGHNVTFDLSFLGAACEACFSLELKNNYVDVLRIANEKLPFLSSHKQVVVAKYFGIRTEGSHRALTDCEICNGCYQKLKELSVGLYDAPMKQVALYTSTNARLAKPFSGKRFFFIGVMSNWYVNDMKNIVRALGGIIEDTVTDAVDIVIAGTADENVLGSEAFKKVLELKKEDNSLALIKDEVFVKTLLARNFAVTQAESEEEQMGLF